MDAAFASLYRDKLEPAIEAHESDRRSAAFSWTVAIVFGAIAAIFLLIVKASAELDANPALLLIAGISGLIAAVFGFNGYTGYQKYRAAFKANVVQALVTAFFPSFKYDADGYVSEAIYNKSRLFLTGYDKYQGEDFAKGQIGQTDLEFSELHTQYKTTHTDSKGRRRTHWHTIFKGLFVNADFHKHLKTETFIFPDVAESVLGSWLGGAIQKMTATLTDRGERVKLESPEFERAFSVCSKDPVEARYVLSPKMMENILGLRQRFGVSPHLAFIEGRVYIAIADSKNHFEPTLWQKVSIDEVYEVFEVFSAIVAMVDDLELNQRIWSKA